MAKAKISHRSTLNEHNLRFDNSARQAKKTTCKMQDCNRPVQNALRHCCNRCATFERYWSNRKKVDRVKRLKTLNFWAKRAQGALK